MATRKSRRTIRTSKTPRKSTTAKRPDPANERLLKAIRNGGLLPPKGRGIPGPLFARDRAGNICYADELAPHEMSNERVDGVIKAVRSARNAITRRTS